MMTFDAFTQCMVTVRGDSITFDNFVLSGGSIAFDAFMRFMVTQEQDAAAGEPGCQQ
jgi:hypothetical protein